MVRTLLMTLAAFALLAAVAPEAEARGRIRAWLQHRREVRQERRSDRTFHPLQRLRDRRAGGCCDATDQAPELIRFPAELEPETRFAASE